MKTWSSTLYNLRPLLEELGSHLCHPDSDNDSAISQPLTHTREAIAACCEQFNAWYQQQQQQQQRQQQQEDDAVNSCENLLSAILLPVQNILKRKGMFAVLVINL